MADVTATWRAEHAEYSRLLEVLEQELAEFRAGGDPDYGLMRDIVTYLHQIADRVHHPREDAVLARLVERDPALELQVNRLRQEHRVVAAAGEELSMRLNEVIAGAVIKREHIETAAAVYLVYYRHHLATEERDFLPRAAKLLTAGDWREIAQAVSSADGFEDHCRVEVLERIAARAGTR